MSLNIILIIGAGGFFGAIARYLMSSGIASWLGTSFPYGTLAVNAVGSFILGFLSRFLVDHLIVEDAIRLGILVGFLGAFTTFSTFSLDSITLLQEGEWITAGMNVVANCLTCIPLCFLGLFLAKQI